MFFYKVDFFIESCIYSISYSLLAAVCVLVSVAYYTLLDRNVMASIQRRKGPNVVGFLGLFQPLSDGLKLLVKEEILPTSASHFLFLVAPVLTFLLSLLTWSLIPYTFFGPLVDVEVGLLFILSISSFSVYGIMLAGWSSNSKYSFLGSLRSTAQIISYEVSLSFLIISVVLCTGSLNVYEIIFHQNSFFLWNCWYLWPQFLLFFFSSIAETNRPPFDLAEAEAELVAGYFVEYSGIAFALFFLGEYSNMLVMCALFVILFWGGWYSPLVFLSGSYCFGFKVALFSFFFIWIRATYPRYRYDQLMQLCVF